MLPTQIVFIFVFFIFDLILNSLINLNKYEIGSNKYARVLGFL
jgi:hypothetical protein